MRSIVICEKADVGRTVSKVIGEKFGPVFSLSGHVIEVVEPERVKSDWKVWSPGILWPGHLYPKDLKSGLKDYLRETVQRINGALKACDHVILAMDPDREGDLIGGELLDYLGYKGRVSRALFVGQDDKSITDAFKNIVPFSDREGYYNAARVREQADKIVNLSLTRTVSTLYAKPGSKAIGVGRVRTPTLGILCRREEEIESFVPQKFYHVEVKAAVENGIAKLTCSKLPDVLIKQASTELMDDVEKHDIESEDALDDAFAPKELLLERLTDFNLAQRLAGSLEGQTHPINRTTSRKETAPPRLYALTELSGAASSKLGWTPAKVLSVAQSLYEQYKIITYPRTNSRYLPESYIATSGAIFAGLTSMDRYDRYKELIGTPTIRKGKKGHYSDSQMKEANHHAIIPNPNTAEEFGAVLASLPPDEAALFDIIARSWLAAHAPNFVYDKTVLSMIIPFENNDWTFSASGTTPVSLGWREILKNDQTRSDSNEFPEILPGEHAHLGEGRVIEAQTKPPGRYSYDSLVKVMKDCWRLVDDPESRSILKACEGIGTDATRASILETLVQQGQIKESGKNVVPTEMGMTIYNLLKKSAPNVVDPIRTAYWERIYDHVVQKEMDVEQAVLKLIKGANSEIKRIIENRDGSISLGQDLPPSPKMKNAVKFIAEKKNIQIPRGTLSSGRLCREFLEEHGEKRVRNEDGTFQPSEEQKKLLKDLAERTGEAVPETAWINKETCSQLIDKMMKDPRSKPPAKPASQKQLDTVRKLCADHGQSVPDGIENDSRACSELISDLIKKSKKSNQYSQTGRPPTQKQVDFLKNLAAEAGKDIPEDVFSDAQKCSEMINQLKKR